MTAQLDGRGSGQHLHLTLCMSTDHLKRRSKLMVHSEFPFSEQLFLEVDFRKKLAQTNQKGQEKETSRNRTQTETDR